MRAGQLRHYLRVMTSRFALLRAIGHPPDVTFIRGFGNTGDLLIQAGARRLLAPLPYREMTTRQLADARGHTAVITGNGGFCIPFHHQYPAALGIIEQNFKRVIMLPTTFDLAEPTVREALSKTNALLFAREPVSYAQIRGMVRSKLAYDCAFFYDMRPYRFRGSGVLRAYRVDPEAVSADVPPDNDDVSLSCDNLDQFLWRIAHHARVETDRAHVMIAAALMGKPVTYRGTTYHKVPALADYSLRDFPVYRAEP
jgi:exopolysaccharide biosynthesis predicted pyruvyltransferase EpsI